MKTTVMGSFPKIPSGPGANVRSAIQRFEKGAISPHQLDDTYTRVVERVVNLGAEAGLDRTTDGQIRWYDLFDPMVRDLDNVQSAGLIRLFDNNFYVRHPLITGRLQYQGGTLAAWSREAAELSAVPVKMTLPGLFTFLALAEDQSYHGEEDLLADLIDVMQLTAKGLRSTGIVEIQWDEPALAKYPDRWAPNVVREAYQRLLRGALPEIEQSLALYWGASTSWLDVFANVPLSRISVDTISEAKVLDRLAAERLPMEVGLGMIDARSVRMEDPHNILDMMAPVMKTQGDNRVWLHPNCGLEFLPPDRAEMKVRLLGDIKALAHG